MEPARCWLLLGVVVLLHQAFGGFANAPILVDLPYISVLYYFFVLQHLL